MPAGIALDIAGGKMYWADFERGTLRRANLDGSQQEILLSGLSGPLSLALQTGPTPVAEPSLLLLGIGAMGLLGYAWRHRPRLATWMPP